ncbi:phage baseplate protein [Paenibacillus sp. 2RAB27]|uniref:phage baseplate protein n=1 Tax=Paenibacillus sp. 2RAB27 TaxID=3232991 RepID=UPI003F9B9198
MVNALLDLDAPEIKDLVYTKTNIGGWFFDAYLRMTHTSRLIITEHPIQVGAAAADHSYMQPQELTIEVGMSNVAKSYVPGQFSGGYSRAVEAHKVLKSLQALRVPIQVHTRLGLYQNMLIEVLSSPDDYQSLNGLRCTVTFKEIQVAQTATVKISARPQVTDNSNRGIPEPSEPNQSILSQMGLKALGQTFLGGN